MKIERTTIPWEHFRSLAENTGAGDHDHLHVSMDSGKVYLAKEGLASRLLTWLGRFPRFCEIAPMKSFIGALNSSVQRKNRNAIAAFAASLSNSSSADTVSYAFKRIAMDGTTPLTLHTIKKIENRVAKAWFAETQGGAKSRLERNDFADQPQVILYMPPTRYSV